MAHDVAPFNVGPGIVCAIGRVECPAYGKMAGYLRADCLEGDNADIAERDVKHRARREERALALLHAWVRESPRGCSPRITSSLHPAKHREPAQPVRLVRGQPRIG